jgi:hypothetical protein
VNLIGLDSNQAMQVAWGSKTTDADGSRQATVLFAQDTTATMTLPDGSQESLSNLDVGATEYTVSSTGLEPMPGLLPATYG